VTSTNLQTQTITKSIRYPVPSATRPEIKHTVSEDPTTGERTCNCEANDHPKTRGRCWHIKAAASGLIKPVVRCTVRPTPEPTVAPDVLPGETIWSAMVRVTGEVRRRREQRDEITYLLDV
jgi:hypothetical protein